MKKNKKNLPPQKKSDEEVSQEDLDVFLPSTSLIEERDRMSPGEMLGHYRLQEELGRGGMGIVYKALDTKLNRTVALKVIVHANKDQKEVARLLREATVTARLDHPNIVKIYDIEEDPVPYFTMEYIEGASLSSLIERRKISAIQAAVLVGKIAEALHVAHKANVIHRDIKPSNIMIPKNNEPRLMDFGLAKLKEENRKEVSLSKSGELLGTPAYMAPEQIEGTPNAASDIYSLGATLYECLTGRPPFQGDTYWNILTQVAMQDIILPRELNPDISVYLEAICLKCLAKEERKRYSSARELAKEIKNFLTNRPIMARPYTRMDRVRKFILRHKVFSGFVVAGMLVLSAFISTLLYYNREINREKEESKLLANAVIKSLKYAYWEHENLRRDQEFLKPVRTIFQHLERLRSREEHEELRGLVFGLSANREEAQKGIADYDRIIQNNPEYGLAYLRRGVLNQKQGRNEEAIRDFTRAISLDPKEVQAYVNRGALYEIEGRKEEALRDFSRAIAIDPEKSEVYYNRGVLYQKQGKDKEAMDDYTRAIALDPKDSQAYYNRGGLHEIQGRNEDALKDYNQAISINPKFGIAYLNRAGVYLKQGRNAEALADYDRAISLAPQFASCYFNRGLLHQKRGRIEEGIRDFTQAIVLDPKDARAYINRGLLYQKQARYEKAVADWEKAMRIDPAKKGKLERLIQESKKMMK